MWQVMQIDFCACYLPAGLETAYVHAGRVWAGGLAWVATPEARVQLSNDRHTTWLVTA